MSREAMQDFLRGGRTGEEVPEGVQQWLTNARERGWREDPGRSLFGHAVRKRSHELVRRQHERAGLYGADFGRAMAAVYRAQLSGASPLQQAVAQRVQNIRTAGANIQSQPRVVY